MSEQSHVFNKGLHIVVATPGRLIDMLEKKRFTFSSCKFLCMDEADRMIDLGFEDDVRNIMSFFKVFILFLVLRIFLIILGSCFSDSARLCFSQLPCQGKFKTLPSSRSSVQSL
jgi:superfamily II DNA/RNA helicase